MIELNNVTFSYKNKKDVQQLTDINLHIKKGEFILLCGKSGCGKTSILRLINGLIPSYYEGKLDGEVLIEGQSVKNKEIYEISRKVSTVFQNPKSQFFNLDTTSEIVFPLENRGTPRDIIKERLKETEEMFDISYLMERSIFALSGGEKQKLAIASAYASDSDIVLMDEPTSNLDMKSIEDIRQMLVNLKKKNKTIIISEHRLYFLKDLIDRAVHIEDGRIKDVYTKDEFNSISKKERIEFGFRIKDLEELELKKNISKKSRIKMDIKDIGFKYKNKQSFAIKIKDETFNYGTIVGIIGKNGQGKSTFANSLIGLEKRAKAEVIISKEKVNRKQRLDKSYLVMQNVGLQLFTESVEEEVKLGMKEDLKTLNVEEVLKKLNIGSIKELHPLSLSGGQQQRVSIGACICSGSEIMFLDEPTSGMDYYHMMEISNIIKETSNENNIIFVISHDLEFLLNTVDTIALFKDGTIKERFDISEGAADKIISELV